MCVLSVYNIYIYMYMYAREERLTLGWPEWWPRGEKELGTVVASSSSGHGVAVDSQGKAESGRRRASREGAMERPLLCFALQK